MDTGVQRVGTGRHGRGTVELFLQGWRGESQDPGDLKLEVTAEEDGADQGPSKRSAKRATQDTLSLRQQQEVQGRSGHGR